MNVTNNEKIPFLEGLLAKLENIPQATSLVTNNQQPSTSKQKNIEDYMVTDTTLKQEMILTAKDFITKLNAGELTNVTGKIIVKGREVYLRDSSIEKLPDNLEIKGSLCLVHCENLTVLPKNLKAQKLLIDECNALSEISGTIEVEKEIRVTDCNGLRVFSPSNTISQLNKCNFSSCKMLKQIPCIDTIIESLTIDDCPALTSLSTIGTINGFVIIKSCPEIKTLPEHWINLPVNPEQDSTGHFRIELINTEIPLAQIAHYNETSQDGVECMLLLEQYSEKPLKNLDEAMFYFNQFASEKKGPMSICKTDNQSILLCELFTTLAIPAKGNSLLRQENADEILDFLSLLSVADVAHRDKAYKRLHLDRKGCKRINNARDIFNTLTDILK